MLDLNAVFLELIKYNVERYFRLCLFKLLIFGYKLIKIIYLNNLFPVSYGTIIHNLHWFVFN